MNSALFSSLSCASLSFPNRIGISPMCMYRAEDGMASEWHFVHYASRAIGGPGLMLVEATAVQPEGRITTGDLGLWKDEQIGGLKRIVDFAHSNGVRIGIQLAHAGRKASCTVPVHGQPQTQMTPTDGGWQVVGPSALAFDEGYQTPKALIAAGMQGIVTAFADAARRALAAGFDFVEIHAAHGYLLHEFLSPLSNRRTDVYGGSFKNRTRLPLAVVDAVRKLWPQQLPLFVRISATDWAEEGWYADESVEFSAQLREHGVQMVDVSSGGLVPHALIPLAPGYQVHFAERIRREANVATATVGLITDPKQAEQIIASQQADLVLIGRESLRDPYWPLRAAATLEAQASWPEPYLRAAPAGSVATAAFEQAESA